MDKMFFLRTMDVVSHADAEAIIQYASGIYETLKDFYGREIRSLYHKYVNPFVQLHVAEIIGTFLRVVSPYTTAVRMSVIRNVEKFISVPASMEPLEFISGIVAHIVEEWNLIDSYKQELEELMKKAEEGEPRPETANMKIVNRWELPRWVQRSEFEVLEKVACLKNTEKSYKYLELIRALNMGVFDSNYFNFMVDTFKNVAPCEDSMIIGVVNRALSALHTGLAYIIGEGILGLLRYTGNESLYYAYYNQIRNYQIGYEQSIFSASTFANFLRTVKSILDQVIGDVEYFEDLYPLLVTASIADFYEVFPDYWLDITVDTQLDTLWYAYVNGITLPRILHIYLRDRQEITTKYNTLRIDIFEGLGAQDILPAPGMIYFANKVRSSEPFCKYLPGYGREELYFEAR